MADADFVIEVRWGLDQFQRLRRRHHRSAATADLVASDQLSQPTALSSLSSNQIFMPKRTGARR